MCSNNPNKHSDRALEAMGLAEVTEQADGDLLYVNPNNGRVFSYHLIGYDGMYYLYQLSQNGCRTFITQGTFTWCHHHAKK
jgi:hypothetical protein